jgi:hypothetical protein
MPRVYYGKLSVSSLGKNDLKNIYIEYIKMEIAKKELTEKVGSVKEKKTANVKEYNHNYYITKSKENVMRREMCPCCNKEVAIWNRPKHIKTKKHLENEYLLTLNDDEKIKYLFDKNPYIKKQIEYLGKKIEKIDKLKENEIFKLNEKIKSLGVSA